MADQLPALIAKIERILAIKPECFITHPSELRIVHGLSDEDLRGMAREQGWRVVRRVGGKQVEFYNDASVSFRPL